MFFKRFRLLPFLTGLALGFIVFFYFKPDGKNGDRVVKWPHPDNVGKVTYRDRNGLCYVFESQIADCAKVKDQLTSYAFE